MNANIMPGLPKYGAVELLEVHQRFFFRALLVASFLEFTLLGAYRVWQFRTEAPTGRPPVVIGHWTELPPAPPVNLDLEARKDWIVPKTKIKAASGIPVPVPDLLADPDRTIPTQGELGRETGLLPGTGGDGEIVYQIKQNLEIEEPPREIYTVEREPMVIKRVAPVYPEVARLAGLEGTVFVKLWIDKTGKVRQVVLLKSDNPIFDQAVIDAAAQWVFTPATMNSGPVPVWMAIPFHFALH
jgi:periplasmic protein TonB